MMTTSAVAAERTTRAVAPTLSALLARVPERIECRVCTAWLPQINFQVQVRTRPNGTPCVQVHRVCRDCRRMMGRLRREEARRLRAAAPRPPSPAALARWEKRARVEEVMAWVAAQFGESVAWLTNPHKTPEAVSARALVAIIGYQEHGVGASFLGTLLHRDHSTIIHYYSVYWHTHHDEIDPLLHEYRLYRQRQVQRAVPRRRAG